MNKKYYNNLIGKKFSRLTINEIISKKDKSNRDRTFAKCKCNCSKSKTIRLDGILEKRVKRSTDVLGYKEGGTYNTQQTLLIKRASSCTG